MAGGHSCALPGGHIGLEGRLPPVELVHITEVVGVPVAQPLERPPREALPPREVAPHDRPELVA